METLLTRRQTLQSLAYSAILGGPLLSLVGCGGTGHSGGGGSTETIGVAVTLPSGFSVPTTDLHAGTAYSTGAISNGSFKAKVSSKGPTFAYLQQRSTGKYVMFGLAGTGTDVSALGSAVALIAMVYGVGLLPAVQARALVALIESNEATATLAGVIEARLAADPYALADGDPQIQTAVQAAFASLGATKAQTKGVFRADPAPLVLIQPQDQSGSNVIQKDATDAIIAVNEIRRPAAVYTYQTGYAAADGTTTTFPTAVAFAGPEDLDPTTSVTGSLVSLGSRPAFANVEGRATALTNYNAQVTKTLYETVILMASGKQDGIDPDPSFFSDPKYANAVAGWKTKRQELNTHAWIGGVLFDLFSSAIGGATAWISYGLVTAAIADIEAAGADAAALVVKAATGDSLTATLGFLKGVSSTNAIVSKAYARAVAQTIVRAEGASEAAITGEMLTAIAGIGALLLGTLAAAGTLLGLADVGATYKDVLTSDKADLWTTTLLKPNVQLSPATATVAAGGSVTLTAATPGVSASDYKFHWTLSAGGNGNLGDPAGNGNVGNDITTAGTSVSLLTAPSDVDGAIYAVSVTAVSLRTGESLGTAKATISVSALAPKIIGASVTEFQSSNYNSASNPDYHYYYLKSLMFTPIEGAVRYVAMTQAAGESEPHDTGGSILAKNLPLKAFDGTVIGNAVVYDSGLAASQQDLDNYIAFHNSQEKDSLYFVHVYFS